MWYSLPSGNSSEYSLSSENVSELPKPQRTAVAIALGIPLPCGSFPFDYFNIISIDCSVSSLTFITLGVGLNNPPLSKKLKSLDSGMCSLEPRD